MQEIDYVVRSWHRAEQPGQPRDYGLPIGAPNALLALDFVSTTTIGNRRNRAVHPNYHGFHGLYFLYADENGLR